MLFLEKHLKELFFCELKFYRREMENFEAMN